MPPSCTRSRDGGRDTSRSARTDRSRSIRPRTPAGRSTSSSWSTICSAAASVCRRSSGFATSSRIGFRTFTKPSRAPSPSTSTRAATSASTPSRSISSARSSRRSSSSDASISSASRRAPSRSCSPSWRSPSNDTPIICNGFKDAEFIEMAMLAQKIGRRIIPVVEKYTELDLILEYAEKVGVRPTIGMRVKLAARGGGRWQSSGGYRSKFGLTVGEILRGLEELKTRGHGGLLPAAALSPRQPDPEHPHRQGGAERGGARVRRAGQGRRRAAVPGRRRRPRRRLRRFTDQFRVERELHAAGVRQRRRLPPADGVRRGEGAASDDRVGERACDRGASQRPGVQRARRLGPRRGGRAEGA